MNKIVHKPKHPFVGIDIEGIDAVLKEKINNQFQYNLIKYIKQYDGDCSLVTHS